MRIAFTRIETEYWHFYRPITRRLTSFEIWAMNMAYECFCHEFNEETKYTVNVGDNFRVWDDVYVYNADLVVRNENGARGMMYLAKHGRLMLAFIFRDGRIDELYACE